MAQRLTAFAPLAEMLGTVPRTHMAVPNLLDIQFQGSDVLFSRHLTHAYM